MLNLSKVPQIDTSDYKNYAEEVRRLVTKELESGVFENVYTIFSSDAGSYGVDILSQLFMPVVSANTIFNNCALSFQETEFIRFLKEVLILVRNDVLRELEEVITTVSNRRFSAIRRFYLGAYQSPTKLTRKEAVDRLQQALMEWSDARFEFIEGIAETVDILKMMRDFIALDATCAQSYKDEHLNNASEFFDEIKRTAASKHGKWIFDKSESSTKYFSSKKGFPKCGFFLKILNSLFDGYHEALTNCLHSITRDLRWNRELKVHLYFGYLAFEARHVWESNFFELGISEETIESIYKSALCFFRDHIKIESFPEYSDNLYYKEVLNIKAVVEYLSEQTPPYSVVTPIKIVNGQGGRKLTAFVKFIDTAISSVCDEEAIPKGAPYGETNRLHIIYMILITRYKFLACPYLFERVRKIACKL